MARQPLRLVRGTAAQTSAYTGPSGEPEFITDTKVMVVHDGATPGGIRQARKDELDARTSAVARSLPEFGGGAALANNGTAMGAVRAATVTNDIIRLPGKAGDTYLFPDGFNFSDRLIDLDPGVIASGVADFTSNGRVTRPLLIKRNQSGAVDQHYYMPDVNRLPAEKAQFLSPESCERTTYSIIDQTGAIYFDASWGGDTQTAFTPATAAVDTATFPAPGNWRGPLVALRAGYEIGAVWDPTISVARAFVVQCSGGVAYLWGGDGASLQLTYKVIGSARVDGTVFDWPERGNDVAWTPQYASWVLRAISDSKVEALLNGVLVATVDLSALGLGYILRGGIMAYGSGQTVSISQMYRAKRRVRRGRPNLSLLVVGDSISTSTFHGNWSAYVSEIVDGTAGIRLTAIDNRAVSGETSAQQLARLQTVGVGSNTDAVIFVGTNDVQGGVAPATTASNVSAMITLMQTAGISVTLVIPYLWYDKVKTPGAAYGYPTSNGEKGAPTRNALIRLGATKGCQVVDLQQVSGQIRAGLAGSLSSWTRDNIHPMIFASKVIARAIAEAIVSARCAMVTASARLAAPAAWLQNGWTYAAANPVFVSLSDDGLCQLGGMLTINAGQRADGVVVMILPEVFRPQRRYCLSGWSEGNRAVLVLVEPTGLVSVYGVGAGGTYVYVDGAPWPLA